MKKRKSNKVRGAAITSIEAYRELLKTGQLKREADQVYRFLDEHGPLNSRELSIRMKKDRTNITRALYDLTEPEEPAIPLIEIVEQKPCKISGRKVYYYNVIRGDQEQVNVT